MILIFLKEALKVDEFAMTNKRSKFNLEVFRVEEGVLLVEISYRDHNLIHASVPEEYGKLCLNLISFDNIIVMRCNISLLIIPVVVILIFVVHGCIQMP